VGIEVGLFNRLLAAFNGREISHRTQEVIALLEADEVISWNVLFVPILVLSLLRNNDRRILFIRHPNESIEIPSYRQFEFSLRLLIGENCLLAYASLLN
jgi:hypothetical protein